VPAATPVGGISVYHKSLIRAAALFLFVVFAGVLPARAGTAIVFVDSPKAEATVPGSFIVGGWALDYMSQNDSGVPVLHVWAYPHTGGAPIFLADVRKGDRPDVARAYGPQFLKAGFSVVIDGLAPGGYMLVVFPFSSVTGGFDFDHALARNIYVSGRTTTAPTPTPAPAPEPEPTTPAPAPTSGGTELRVLQWNLHHGGFGTDGVYDTNRVAEWVAAMRPDVILFNEIEKNTGWGHEDQPEVYRALLQQKTGRKWYYVFAQEFGDWSANGKGNIIYSTFPINYSDRYLMVQNADRSVGMANITVSGVPITLISTHLDPYDQSLRLAQAKEVTTWSSAQPENRIITGDMNAWPDQTSIGQFNKYYYDSWTVAENQGTASTFSGNTGQTKNGRIDYIFYSKSSTNLTVKSSRVYDTRDANGDMPSDHRPVLTTFIVK
jgi:endonuclease/exonuclease/phosphatase family metal-dependent hydrolase